MVFASLTCLTERPRRALLSKRARRPFGRRYACPLWRSPLRGSVVGSYEPQTERHRPQDKPQPTDQTRTPTPTPTPTLRAAPRQTAATRPPACRRPLPAHAPRQRPATPPRCHVACWPCADKTAYAYGSGGSGSALLPEAGRKWGFGKAMRMFREARPAPTVHADARPGRPRYTAPHTRPTPATLPRMTPTANTAPATPCAVGRWRFAPTRPGEGGHDPGDGRHGPPQCDPRRRRHLSAEAIRREGGKVSPGPPARKNNLRSSTSRKRNPSLSLVNARRRCRRTRRAWSPQSRPRPGFIAERRGRYALPPARSPVLLPDPHGDGRRAGYAVRGLPTSGKSAVESSNPWKPGTRRPVPGKRPPRMPQDWRTRGGAGLPIPRLPHFRQRPCTALARALQSLRRTPATASRTRRAWSPQCDPPATPRTAARSPGTGPASSLSAGGATLFRRPGRRSLQCYPHADEHRAGYAVRGRGAGASRLRAQATPAHGGRGARASGGKGASEHRAGDGTRRGQTEKDARGRGGPPPGPALSLSAGGATLFRRDRSAVLAVRSPGGRTPHRLRRARRRALALSRPRAQAKAATIPATVGTIRRSPIRAAGKGISPDPSARKDNLRFSTSRKRNPSLSLVDGRADPAAVRSAGDAQDAAAVPAPARLLR